jgi:TorA maturation chaperone TorD
MRADVAVSLRLFASVFAREVNEALLHEIGAARRAMGEALGRDPIGDLPPGEARARVEALAVEYCRLFVGPRGHMPPVESVALGQGRFWGPATEAVASFYRLAGLQASREACVPPDHISMELDCLATLEEQGRADQAQAFAREHVLQWLPRLTRHVRERATLAFYPAWCCGTETLLTELYGGET